MSGHSDDCEAGRGTEAKCDWNGKLEWQAGRAPAYSQMLNSHRLLLVPCPQWVLMKTPITNQTRPKIPDPVFVFFWRTTTITFDFW